MYAVGPLSTSFHFKDNKKVMMWSQLLCEMLAYDLSWLSHGQFDAHVHCSSVRFHSMLVTGQGTQKYYYYGQVWFDVEGCCFVVCYVSEQLQLDSQWKGCHVQCNFEHWPSALSFANHFCHLAIFRTVSRVKEFGWFSQTVSLSITSNINPRGSCCTSLSIRNLVDCCGFKQMWGYPSDSQEIVWGSQALFINGTQEAPPFKMLPVVWGTSMNWWVDWFGSKLNHNQMTPIRDLDAYKKHR